MRLLGRRGGEAGEEGEGEAKRHSPPSVVIFEGWVTSGPLLSS